MTYFKLSSSLKSLAVASVLLTGLSFTPVQAQDAAFTDAQKAAITSILEGHLKEKPEIVIEAITLHQENEALAEEEKAKVAVKSSLGKLTQDGLPFIGNPDASVTVVEFFDYNCGYCKRAVPDIQATLEKDSDVKFVFHEMPILGPSSRTAAQYALAAHKQGKYFEYHVALMEFRGEKNDKTLEKLAKDVGLDVEKAKADANSKEIAAMIEESMTLASKIGIRGTPAFIVGDKLFRGYLGPDGLQSEIKTARKK